MSRKFDTALDDCLNLLRTGASMADCLARYPEHAEELRPLLSLASAVRSVPTPRPDPATVHANRLRMLDAAKTAAEPRQWRGLAPFAWVWRLSSGLQVQPLARAALTLVAAVALVSLAAGALFTSAADSLPGQTLYSVKRFGENVRLSLTLNPAARQELQTEYLLERRHEVRQILDARQRAVLEFRAELEELGNDYWIVGGLKVILDSDTLVEGHVTVGAMVIVQASSSGNGTLRALKLQVLTNPLLLTSVIPATPTPTPSPLPTAAPTVTPTPSPMPTAAPTVTPTPSSTSTLIATPTPSPVPTEPSTPLPSATSMPTHTEEPRSTDPPEENETEEPDSTDDPDPTDTEEPDSDETEPTETEESDSTDHPDPTHTEEPDSTDEGKQTETEDSVSSGLPDLDHTSQARFTSIPDPTCTRELDSADHPDPTLSRNPIPLTSVNQPRPRSRNPATRLICMIPTFPGPTTPSQTAERLAGPPPA